MEDYFGAIKEKVSVSGTVETVIFQSDDTGYTVCEIADEDGFPVTLVGTMPYIVEGDTLSVVGKWVNHPTYGKQLKVDMFEKTLPSSESDMIRYLSSGVIRGIGPKTAKKIVAQFGDDTFDVLGNHPDWLSEIPGISRKKAEDIKQSFSEIAGARSVMMFCGKQFGNAISMKIYKKWGGSAIDLIKANPYLLCEEFSGIGFKRADVMAESLGISHDSYERINAGICYTLNMCSHSNGHTCMPISLLTETTAKTIEVPPDKIAPVIGTMVTSGKLISETVGDETYIYLKRYRDAEVYTAKKLKIINTSCPKLDPGDIGMFIKRAETDSGITYALKQKEAVASALSSGIMILTGGPGTGKTTVIKGLISIFKSLGLKVALSAPTGRAAKRMSEATDHEAKTVHRLLEMQHNENDELRFARCETNYLDENVIIVDESSMLDALLLEALLKAVKPGARIIFIGDADQLPSVGCGNILHDLISSDAFNVVRLTEIFRQAEESMIIVNAHMINEGKMPVTDNKSKSEDFFFLKRSRDTDTAATVINLIKERLPKAYGKNIFDDIQIITPSRKGEAGTERLNVLLQEALNPKDRTKSEKQFHGVLFRDGDRIMQTKNNYDIEWEKDGYEGIGVFNGDIGYIVSIDAADESAALSFDGREAEYDFSGFDELEHAYAVTVHKSQGSEYPIVIIPLYRCAPMLLTRNLLYTAVTRASRMVILVGSEEVLKTMVDNNRSVIRYTGLGRLLTNNE